MNSGEIRKRFLDFFEKRGHKIIPSASLVPENDPSVLFTTAGMQPLVPYLLGEPHPQGKRLADVQKCVRTGDIEEIGDKTHLTFFEMLGNWSLGDYFKKEAISWSYELLTSKEEGFGLDPNRLYITVFEGDQNAPKDTESFEIWKSLGIPEHRIYFLGAKSNWWSAGDNGPCGPDSEMFYDITEEGLGDLSKEEFLKADKEQKVVEIWNDVFMEYEKKDGKVIGKLKNQNVDTGAGLERISAVLQKKDNVFDTDIFFPVMEKIKSLAKISEIRRERIIADHMRTAIMLASDGVLPSNTDQGYILRRLIRRAVIAADVLEIPEGSLKEFVGVVERIYGDIYPAVRHSKNDIENLISKEEEKFRETLKSGMREFEKLSGKEISGKDAFLLFSTYGFPLEVTKELAEEKGVSVDETSFKEEMEKHQALSRSGAEQKFKGGLAGHSEEEIKYHTATHLLNQALHDVLGEGVSQKGSNITPERLRFDFTHGAKMTDEEKQKVEEIVNKKIEEDLPVRSVVLPKEEAEKTGAFHVFGDKYGDMVSVYFVGQSLENAYSKEFCGGPHVSRTGVLGKFKIKKEEAVSAGVRRIKATLE